MRNWILGGLLACCTSGGIAFVLAKNSTDSHCGPCLKQPAALADGQVESDRSLKATASGTCEKCSKGPPVVDVVDLDRTFLMADGTRPPVSFEEPPLAKPRGEVTPVVFISPIPAVEVAPMPRPVD